MKFFVTALALCVLQSSVVTAFSPQAPKPAFHTGLASSLEGAQAPDLKRTQTTNTEVAPGQGYGAPLTSQGRSGDNVQDIWDTMAPITVQGGSLRTWSFASSAVDFVQVLLRTDGRPLNSDVELWQGPDNSPQRMGVYIEDGSVRPFSAVIATPRDSNAIAIRNTGFLEFPLSAIVEADSGDAGLGAMLRGLFEQKGRTVQGGAVFTQPFDSSVQSVQVLLKTDGRPLNARIELLQGPNNNKQVIELYTEDGYERPLFLVIDTPGTGNVVRIVNTATVEFPLAATIEPYVVEPGGGGGAMGRSIL